MVVTIIKGTDDCGPVGHGMVRLEKAFRDAGISFKRYKYLQGQLELGLIFIGLANEPMIYHLEDKCPLPPESFSISVRQNALVVAGSDERGLTYALYALAEQIESIGEESILQPTTMRQTPANAVRGVDKVIMITEDAEWWMSEAYWRFYLEMLLEARFNRLCIITGYDTAYLAPPYPFFVDVPGYENVKLSSNVKPGRAEHLHALRQLGRLCHEYGMEFSLAIWQQWARQEKTVTLVEGLDDAEMLYDYCYNGVRQLISHCPELDVIHFRVNHESGVGTRVSAEKYWLHQIDGVAEAKSAGADIRLELRAKGMTDEMVRHAKSHGLDVTVSTKYTCEHMGLPYHMTTMRTEEINDIENLNYSRRYSYADMLKKPRQHRFLFRLWANGSNTLFTWGDPDYARRFALSLELGQAEGYEIMAPLSNKGGHEYEKETGWNLFDDPRYQPETWEDSRYWLFYFLLGRLGYDPETPEEVWLVPMRAHFGEAAKPMMEAITQASRVMPLIVDSHFTEHPQHVYWPEVCTGASLFADNNVQHRFLREHRTYQASTPRDEALFYSIDQFVRAEGAGNHDGRYTPYQVYAWFGEIIEQGGTALAKAQKVGLPESPEARGAALDVEMLLTLAAFHRYKMMAAIGLSYFQQLGDSSRLAEASEYMDAARDTWSELVDIGQPYHSSLMFVSGDDCVRKGTWADYKIELERDSTQLAAMAAAHPDVVLAPILRAINVMPAFSDNLPAEHLSGKPLAVRVYTSHNLPGELRIRARHTNQLELAFRAYPMERVEDGWRGTIPACEFSDDWDTLVYFDGIDTHGDGIIYPGLSSVSHHTPYKVIRVVCDK